MITKIHRLSPLHSRGRAIVSCCLQASAGQEFHLCSGMVRTGSREGISRWVDFGKVFVAGTFCQLLASKLFRKHSPVSSSSWSVVICVTWDTSCSSLMWSLAVAPLRPLQEDKMWGCSYLLTLLAQNKFPERSQNLENKISVEPKRKWLRKEEKEGKWHVTEVVS